MNRSCSTCGEGMTRDAVWCGSCGTRIEVPTSGRRIGIGAGVAGVAIAAIVGIGALVGTLLFPETADNPDGAPTVAADRCNLDAEEPTCAEWSADTPGGASIVAHTAVVTMETAALVAVDIATGREFWRRDLRVADDAETAPHLQTRSGLLVANLAHGGVAGIDPLDGSLVWQRRTGHALDNGGRADGMLVTALFGGTGLAGVDPFDGRTMWSISLDVHAQTEIQVLDGVVVAVNEGVLRVIDRATGELRWEVLDRVSAVRGALDNLLVASLEPSPRRAAGSLVGYDLGTGQRIWTRAQARGQRTVMSRAAVYTQAENTPLERLEPTTGNPMWIVGGVRLADVRLDRDLLARGVPVLADRWLQLLDPSTGEKMQESRVGRDGVTELLIGRAGDIIAVTPDGLHRFPVEGPTRAEIDVLGAHVIAAQPLLVDTRDGRRMRVKDVEPSSTPACTVGLRRARCRSWSIVSDLPDVEVAGDTVVTVVAAAVQGADVTTGLVKWRVRIGDDPGARPVAATAHTIIVSGVSTHALDPATGTVLWDVTGSHVPLDGLPDDAIAVARAGTISLIDVDSGQDLEVLPVQLGDETAVGLTDATIVTWDGVPGLGPLVVRDRLTGEVLHTQVFDGAEVHTTASGIFADNGGAVERRVPDTGDVVWRIPAGSLVWPGDSSADRHLLVQDIGGEKGLGSLVDPFIGASFWTRPTAPLSTWFRRGGDLLLVTSTGVDVVDDLSRDVWRYEAPSPHVVNVDPLLVFEDGLVTLIRDPTADVGQ